MRVIRGAAAPVDAGMEAGEVPRLVVQPVSCFVRSFQVAVNGTTRHLPGFYFFFNFFLYFKSDASRLGNNRHDYRGCTR